MLPAESPRPPSIPRLRNNPKRSMLCLTTVVLLDCVVVSIKDDAVVSFRLHRSFYTTSRYSTSRNSMPTSRSLRRKQWREQPNTIYLGPPQPGIINQP